MTDETISSDRSDAVSAVRAPETAEREDAGQTMYRFAADLYPLCRSITGEGLRETLRRIGRRIPLAVREVPTGTRVFDWTVPREWTIRDAYVRNSRGDVVIDFKASNLHVVSYSVPVRRTMPLAELRPHLHTLPDRPDWIPYRTSYYREEWGFCLTHRRMLALEEGDYEVVIDSSLQHGSLTYGECVVPGRLADEVLVSCHVCHPSLCNDNLSGIAVATWLAEAIGRAPRRYSYRFLFIPGTIGSITWLCLNEEGVSRIRHGLVAACLGDPGRFTYKRSRRGDAEIDRVVAYVLRHSGRDYEIEEFSPYGYDERQYCSPGFDLPVGCLSRTPHGRFPEYHTSADNLEFIRPECLGESLSLYLAVVDVLERNRTYVNTNPKGEPQLGARGLYHTLGGAGDPERTQQAMLWVLNLSDGAHDLLSISERSRLPFGAVRAAADALLAHGLLREVEA
jgi:aminopeptidase-like protein